MDKLFLDAMRNRLTELRAEFMATAAVSAESSQVVELDQAKVGRLSRMDALQAQAMSQASDRRREQSLRMIALTLGRIDDGTFGACRGCEEPIARARLEFDPTALYCIACARKSEQGD